MEYKDQADQYRRLQELYGDMSDEQIEAMAAKLDDYTEMAQQVLRAEMAKRGLGTPAKADAEDPIEAARQALLAELARDRAKLDEKNDANPTEGLGNDAAARGLDPSGYDWIPIWQVDDASQAREVMHFLESAGVESRLGPENLKNVDTYKGSYEEGVEVKVMKFQARFALEGLNRLAPRAPDEEEAAAQEFAGCCPQCRSQDIIFEGIETPPQAGPAPDAIYNWTCEACGHHWQDDGVVER